MSYNEIHSKERRRFVRRATKCAEKISKRLDKMVLLSKHHKCEAYADDVKEIFAAVEQSMAEAKKQMEPVNETN